MSKSKEGQKLQVQIRFATLAFYAACLSFLISCGDNQNQYLAQPLAASETVNPELTSTPYVLKANFTSTPRSKKLTPTKIPSTPTPSPVPLNNGKVVEVKAENLSVKETAAVLEKNITPSVKPTQVERPNRFGEHLIFDKLGLEMLRDSINSNNFYPQPPSLGKNDPKSCEQSPTVKLKLGQEILILDPIAEITNSVSFYEYLGKISEIQDDLIVVTVTYNNKQMIIVFDKMVSGSNVLYKLSKIHTDSNHSFTDPTFYEQDIFIQGIEKSTSATELYRMFCENISNFKETKVNASSGGRGLATAI